jgi:hypothetical protein
MHKKFKIIPSAFLCLLLCVIFYSNVKAQNLSLEKDFLTDYLRNKQLTDTNLSNYSFNIRPLALNNKIDNLYKPISYKKGVYILPMVFNSTINSHHAIGENFGAMLPAVSPEVYLSSGIYFNYKKWEIQLQPELIYSNNRPFETFSHENYDPIWASYYNWLNKIDAPEQFGIKPFLKIFPGQSSIKYNFKENWSASLSTENIWWGPGIKNSLLMTNNAPGFLHISIQTKKPITTKWGSLEAQSVFGKLDNSGIFPPDTNRVMNSSFLYVPKINDWRFFTGYAFSFQPKILPGLFLGAASSTILYQKDMSGVFDILPFTGLLVSNAEKANLKSSYGSIFFRYLLKEAHAEVYAEYGRSDTRGYVVGLRKVTNINKHNNRFEVTAEVTQLDDQKSAEIYNATSWYISASVRHGYTQYGKVIGAGIGPGSNSQSIDISLLKGKAKFGILFERIVHNNDFYYNAYYPINNWKNHWIDMSALYHAYFKVKNNFFIKAQLGVTKSLNYDWWVIPLIDPVLPGNGYDPINVHGNLMVIYKWK